MSSVKTKLNNLQTEVAACWDGASHLIHPFEVEEVRLTDALLQLAELGGRSGDASTDGLLRSTEGEIKRLGARLLQLKQQCM